MRIALYGMENQTWIDSGMPLRLFSYDGASYRAQLLADKNYEEKNEKSPKISGGDAGTVFWIWQALEKSKDKCLDIPEELKPFVDDCRMNLYEIACLTDEQVQLFTSGFKIVGDYFVQTRRNKNYTVPQTATTHVHDLLQLMSVMTKDSRCENAYCPEMERMETTMCEVLDCIENKKGGQKGQERILALNHYVPADNRIEDLKKATKEQTYREKLPAKIFPDGVRQ